MLLYIQHPLYPSGCLSVYQGCFVLFTKILCCSLQKSSKILFLPLSLIRNWLNWISRWIKSLSQVHQWLAYGCLDTLSFFSAESWGAMDTNVICWRTGMGNLSKGMSMSKCQPTKLPYNFSLFTFYWGPQRLQEDCLRVYELINLQ